MQAMSPEERDAFEARQEAARYKAQVEQFEQQQQQAEVSRAQEHAKGEWIQHFTQALESLGEGANYASLGEMARIQAGLLATGVDLTPAQVAQEYQSRQSASAEKWALSRAEAFTSGKLPADKFLASVPVPLRRALAQAELKALEARGVPIARTRMEQPAPTPAPNEPRKFISAREVNENLRRLMYKK
jgi:hypothetical protein